MGEFDVVENHLLHGKYPEGYTKAKKEICGENAETTRLDPPNIIECDRCNHWFHFKCDYLMYIIVFCFHNIVLCMLLQLVKVYILAIEIEQ